MCNSSEPNPSWTSLLAVATCYVKRPSHTWDINTDHADIFIPLLGLLISLTFVESLPKLQASLRQVQHQQSLRESPPLLKNQAINTFLMCHVEPRRLRDPLRGLWSRLGRISPASPTPGLEGPFCVSATWRRHGATSTLSKADGSWGTGGLFTRSGSRRGRAVGSAPAMPRPSASGDVGRYAPT